MHLIDLDILDAERGIIAHQVNARGVAGAGLALKLSQKYPEAMLRYKVTRPRLGACLLVKIDGPQPLYIANLVGQQDYGTDKRQTNYAGLAAALMDLNKLIALYNLRDLPVYFPYGMGCGLAGGDWELVLELLEFYFPEDTVTKLPTAAEVKKWKRR